LGTIVTTTKANVLAANAAVASDSSSWNNLNLGFDPTTTVNTTLSNSNLTATLNLVAGIPGARIASGISTGKFYFEIRTPSPSQGLTSFMGLLALSGTYTNMFSGMSLSAGVHTTNGIVIIETVTPGVTLGVFAVNDVLGVAVDFDAHLVWFRRNNGNWNNSGTANPATGVGGLTFSSASYPAGPAVNFAGTPALGDSYTINLGATSYANAAPSGFGNWIAWTPFKLTATLSAPQPGMAGYLHARVRTAKPSTTYYLDPKILLS
jgi:hypothetical protein